jgi:N-acetylmuramoyl-L-alanine amidase
VAAAESTITLTAPPLAPTPTGSTTSTRSAAAFVVCIDPGHQTHNDEKLEPIGPGSKTESARATGGFTGVATGLPEYEIDLELGARLKKRLVAQGVHVVMTRTANDVQLSNAERAKIANRAHADLFVRIHCSASTVATDSGLSVLFPAKNRWTASIASSSQAAARFIESSAVHASGARNRGAHSQAGVVGFNWSKVPAVMVQAGFLSNPIEDKLLATPSYQDHLATGLADGILAYLRQKAKK